MSKLTELAVQHTELRSVDILIADLLKELFVKQYGAATIIFIAQAGKVTNIKKGVEQSIKLS